MRVAAAAAEAVVVVAGVAKHREDDILKYPRNFMRRMDIS